MTRYENLLLEIEKDGIFFEESKSSKDAPSMVIEDDSDYAIFLNRKAFDTEAERFCALACREPV